MIPFAIAGVQMHVSATESNLEAMSAQIDIAMARFPWVQMVMFSELAPFGPLMHNIQTLPGPAEAAFCEMAARHGIWLVPGSMFERDGESVYNTASVIDPTGTVVGRHRKLFPLNRTWIRARTSLFLMCRMLVVSGFPSAMTCGSRKPPGRWSPWARK